MYTKEVYCEFAKPDDSPRPIRLRVKIKRCIPTGAHTLRAAITFWQQNKNLKSCQSKLNVK